MAGPRRFDHDEAYARWQAGESRTAIARSYGVAPAAIYRALKRLDPEWREGDNARNSRYQREHYRRLCVRGCGRIAWHGPGPERTGVCHRCASNDQATTVRDDALRCCECHEWKPDTAFAHRTGRFARRERHAVCRGCQAAVRARARARHKTPCLGCGTPRLADPRSRDSGYCRHCYPTHRQAA